MQHRLALWLHNAILRAFPLEPRFAGDAFLERITQSIVPSYTSDRGHWASALALQLAANGPLPAAEWAAFLVEHLDVHPWVTRVDVSSSGHINLFLTAAALHEHWQPLWAQSLKRLASSERVSYGCLENDSVAYAKQRLAHFLEDFAAQQPDKYAQLTGFSSDVTHWLALQEEVDWRLSGTLLEVYAVFESKNVDQVGYKKRRLASALHNYYNALLVLAERKPIQRLRLTLLMLCFGILTANVQSPEKNG